MADHADSPFRALWRGKSKSGKDKYYGQHTCPSCFMDIGLNVFPNTRKSNEKAPDFHFSLIKKEPRS